MKTHHPNLDGYSEPVGIAMGEEPKQSTSIRIGELEIQLMAAWETIDKLTAQHSFYNYSHGELEAALGGDAANSIRNQVLLRRYRIKTRSCK